MEIQNLAHVSKIMRSHKHIRGPQMGPIPKVGYHCLSIPLALPSFLTIYTSLSLLTGIPQPASFKFMSHLPKLDLFHIGVTEGAHRFMQINRPIINGMSDSQKNTCAYRYGNPVGVWISFGYWLNVYRSYLAEIKLIYYPENLHKSGLSPDNCWTHLNN